MHMIHFIQLEGSNVTPPARFVSGSSRIIRYKYSAVLPGGVVDSQTLKARKGLSRKQYYSSTNRMMKAGLTQRKNNRFSLERWGY